MAALTIDGKPVPSVSHPAKQMGRRAAQNILAQIAGKSASDFKHIDYGSLATISRKSAVALLGPLKLSGVPAWLTRLLAHIYFLIGFCNRLIVMIDWAWAYFSFQRYAQVMIGAWRHTPTSPGKDQYLLRLDLCDLNQLRVLDEFARDQPAEFSRQAWCGVGAILTQARLDISMIQRLQY
jgi:hypothetical protein